MRLLCRRSHGRRIRWRLEGVAAWRHPRNRVPASHVRRSGFARSCSSPSRTWRRPRPSPSPSRPAPRTPPAPFRWPPLLALIACLFVALSIGELARHLPSAGSFYTYASKGIHPWMGFLVAWAYAFAEAFIASFLFLIFAITVSGHAEHGVRMVHRHLVDLGRPVLAARLRPRLRGHPDLDRGRDDHGRVRDHRLRRACDLAHHRGRFEQHAVRVHHAATRPRRATAASPA